jgi:hypothetical protein
VSNWCSCALHVCVGLVWNFGSGAKARPGRYSIRCAGDEMQSCPLQAVVSQRQSSLQRFGYTRRPSHFSSAADGRTCGRLTVTLSRALALAWANTVLI